MARPRKFKEPDVMAAAYRQFNATGYHGTSVEDLSHATGLSKGSLYGAFGDKEALFQRVFEEYCSGVETGTEALLEGPEDEALDRIRLWLRAPEDSEPGGCLLAKGTAELAGENNDVAARSLAAHEALLDTCCRLVEAAQRAGRLDPAADPTALGGLILTTQRGLDALARAGVSAAVRNGIADAAIDNIAMASAGS